MSVLSKYARIAIPSTSTMSELNFILTLASIGVPEIRPIIFQNSISILMLSSMVMVTVMNGQLKLRNVD